METNRPTQKTIFRACRVCFEAQNRIACISRSHLTERIPLFSSCIFMCLLNVIITIIFRFLTVQSDLNSVCAGQNETDGETRQMKEDEKQLGRHEGEEEEGYTGKTAGKKGKQRTATPAQAVYFHDFRALVNI